MLNATRKFCYRLFILVLLVLSACAPTIYEEVKYNPESVSKMSVEEAREYIKQGLQGKETCDVVQGKLFYQDVSNVEFTPSVMKIHQTKKLDRAIRLEGMTIMAFGDLTVWDKEWHNLEGQQYLYFSTRDAMELQRTVDALTVLKQAAERATEELKQAAKQAAERTAKAAEQNDEIKFQKVLQAYQAAVVKPQLPEEARKFKVQAEDAVHDKEFVAAVDLYGQAIKIAPWWPEGHFNRALVLGETKEYKTAIIEMKRYLALAPNAPNARAAQDKIYAWERKVQKHN